MRSALSSLVVTSVAGSVLVAGGAFSVFNDSGTAAGPLTGGTVELALDGVAASSAQLVLRGACDSAYVNIADTNSPIVPRVNLGTVNNTGCTSTFTVTNTGSLPFGLAGTSVADTVVPGATAACFTSSVTDGLAGVVVPGADRVVTVRTLTGSDEASCQGRQDSVTVTVQAVEALAPVVPPVVLARCIDAVPSVVRDLLYSGTPNVKDNITQYVSVNGSCSGTVLSVQTLVEADTEAAARAVCIALVAGTQASPLAPVGYPVSNRTFACR